jgi:kynurenine formamidase
VVGKGNDVSSPITGVVAGQASIVLIRVAVTETLAAMSARLSNWGRWGDSDELGTLNFINPAKVRRATECVRSGEVIELSIPLNSDGPQHNRPRRFNPIHLMTALPRDPVGPEGIGAGDDVLMMPLQAATQRDSLAHIAHRGLLYGGRSADQVTVAGAMVNSICAISAHVASRGVLVDVARWRQVDALGGGHTINAAELTDALESEATSVGEGDILLVRTGFLEKCRRHHWSGFFDESPGLGLDTLDWIAEHRIAGVATDTVAVEVRPSPLANIRSPFHVVALVHMGLLLGEIFDLEQLSQRCAEDRAFDFFFVAPPLRVTGGIGSPINPYAIR